MANGSNANMAFPFIANLAGLIAAAVACLLIILPALFGFSPIDLFYLLSFAPNLPSPDKSPSTTSKSFVCEPSAYRTEIVSLDPLLIYIHSFLREDEINALLAAAEPLFKPSQVTKFAQKIDTADRTSSSAGLPLQDPAVQCVLGRAREFMGSTMVEGRDEMGSPQLVRYTAAQRFNVHHDWYETPQWAYDGSNRKFNRVASFFAILQDNCTDGETYFPYIGGEPAQKDSSSTAGSVGSRRWEKLDPVWRQHEDGGLAFRPVRGNALFWVNLHANSTGDERTMHAGLQVGQGLKTAMNIWPRQFYPIH